MPWKFNPFTGNLDYYETASEDADIDGGSPADVYGGLEDLEVDGGTP
jgi:hypothetical protein